MAATPVLIPVEEYLRTTYRPDRDYVDGELLERNMGETPHARLQAFFLRFFAAHEDEWNVEALPEQRVQVGVTRYRIPDLMLAALPNRDELIVRTAPLLCVEILSSRDRMDRLQQRIDDYAGMGVVASWVIDPWRGTAFQAFADGVLQPVAAEARLTVPGTFIAIAVAEIFTELDRIEQRARRAADSPTR
jgi:Uma2 family endonuclease